VIVVVIWLKPDYTEMNAFREFIEENVRWFRGHAPETDPAMDEAERKLGIRFPDDLRWMLREYGYWHATGVSSLQETVTNTLAAREHLNLPARFVVLYDHQDGGVILLDTCTNLHTGQNKVYNSAWEFVPDGIETDIVYPSLLEYVRDVVARQCGFIAEADIDYDPTKYHQT
jgi:hypothetical protein